MNKNKLIFKNMLKDSYKSPKGFKVIKKGDILESERRQGFQKDGKPIGKPTDIDKRIKESSYEN